MTSREQPSWHDLLDLVARLDGGAYDAVSVQIGDISVSLARGGAVPVPAAVVASGPGTPAAADSAPPVASSPGATITAPMVGVFFRRPSPGAPPFVEEGAEVSADTTIGILEIMKLMSPVTAGTAGTLTRFLVADGEAVEFAQPLAVLDTGSA